jgi:hypothetical protein
VFLLFPLGEGVDEGTDVFDEVLLAVVVVAVETGDLTLMGSDEDLAAGVAYFGSAEAEVGGETRFGQHGGCLSPYL